MSKKIVTALSATRYRGSGWVDASSVAGDALRRFELSAAALAGTVVEIWASSDNTAATDYTGVPPSAGAKPPTPPGGRLVSTITGPATPLNINPDPAQPTSPAQTQANSVAAEAYYYNFIRISADTGAVNMILVGEVAEGSGGEGTNIIQGGQSLGGDMLIGTTDAHGVNLEANEQVGYAQASDGTIVVGSRVAGTSTRILGGDPTVAGPFSGEASLIAAGPAGMSAQGGDASVSASGNVNLLASGSYRIGADSHAFRIGEIAYAVGDFGSPGDAQGCDFILVGQVPGSGAGEHVNMNLGLEDGKAYEISWKAVATGPGATPDVSTWSAFGSAATSCFQQSGVITLVGVTGASTHKATAGAAGGWTLAVSITAGTPDQLTWTFTDVGSTENVRVIVQLWITELLQS